MGSEQRKVNRCTDGLVEWDWNAPLTGVGLGENKSEIISAVLDNVDCTSGIFIDEIVPVNIDDLHPVAGKI
jgi:hypothetical protein